MAASVSDGGVTSGSQPLPVLDIPRPFEVLSDVSNDSSHNGRDCDSQEVAVSERLAQPPAAVAAAPSVGTSSSGHAVPKGPQDNSSLSFNNKSKKKSKKRKDKEKSKDKEKGREKERKSSEEPSTAFEMSPKDLKNNSVLLKSTGGSNTRLHGIGSGVFYIKLGLCVDEWS